MTNRRSVLAVLAMLVAALVWWLQPADSGPTTATDPSSSPTNGQASGQTTDPASGLDWVDLGSLPAEAKETLSLIEAGGPFPYDQDGGTFGNFEGLLPDHQRGYYREYTVDTPGSADRGARRIVSGSSGEYYWTEDHYESFERIRR